MLRTPWISVQNNYVIVVKLNCNIVHMTGHNNAVSREGCLPYDHSLSYYIYNNIRNNSVIGVIYIYVVDMTGQNNAVNNNAYDPSLSHACTLI